MDTLYLIGNGFDLHHNLRTKYCHFHRYLIENEPDLEVQLNKFFDFSIEDKLWSDFEIDLGTFKYDTFYSDSDFKIFTSSDIFSFDFQENAKERTTELVNRIKDAFYRWLSLVEIKNLTPILRLDTNSLFLTFNYTKLSLVSG